MVVGDHEWQRMSPEARGKYLEILRRMPPGKKLKITLEYCDFIREVMAAGIRARHPGISDEEVRKEMIRRTLPPDLVRKVYGW